MAKINTVDNWFSFTPIEFCQCIYYTTRTSCNVQTAACMHTIAFLKTLNNELLNVTERWPTLKYIDDHGIIITFTDHTQISFTYILHVPRVSSFSNSSSLISRSKFSSILSMEKVGVDTRRATFSTAFK